MLLERVLRAHGGRESWKARRGFTAHVAIGGALLPAFQALPHEGGHLTGRQRPILCDLTVEGACQRPFLRLPGAMPPDHDAIYAPRRCEIRAQDGQLLARRDMPFRPAFPTPAPPAPIDRAALLGAMLWNTLAGPFALTLGGKARDDGDGHVDIALPAGIDPLSPRRRWALDEAGLIRRACYALAIAPGLMVVETMRAPAVFDGIRIPTLRRIARAQGGRDDPPLVDIEIFDLRFT